MQFHSVRIVATLRKKGSSIVHVIESNFADRFCGDSRMYGIRLIISILVLNWAAKGTEIDDIQCRNWCKSQPAVQTVDGCLCGTKMDGLEARSFDAFIGVPFAKPPLGSLRFANPVPFDPWEGHLNASTIKPICIQKNDFYLSKTVQGQEDCLYLNIYRPKKCKCKKLPVMVYIHGGGNIVGNGGPMEFGPEKFMDTRKVILVTVQYRLGPFGFLSTEDQSAPGNFGLKDQSLALRWIQRNIESFGGDQRRVTIFGNSAGGAAVQLHMMSPLSKGLFSKAISQSGSVLASWSNADPDQLGLARRLALAADVTGADRMSSGKLIDALRNVDASKLLTSVDKLKIYRNYPIFLFRPVTEKYVNKETFLHEDPKELWAAGRYHKVPWMTGFVSDEGVIVLLGILSNSTYLREFIENQQELLPLLVEVRPSSVPAVIEKFFGGNPIDPSNAIVLAQVASEVAFQYPMMASILQHLINDPHSKAPLTLYYFNFKGRYSCSVLNPILATPDNSGACHTEELMYLFRQRTKYLDFPKHSPEDGMSRLLVNEWVHFAQKGRLTLPKHEQPLRQLGMVEFTNSDDASGVSAVYRDFEDKKVTELWKMFRWWNIVNNQL